MISQLRPISIEIDSPENLISTQDLQLRSDQSSSQSFEIPNIEITFDDIMKLCTKNPFYDTEYQDDLRRICMKFINPQNDIDEQKYLFATYLDRALQENKDFSAIFLNNLMSNIAMMDSEYTDMSRQNNAKIYSNFSCALLTAFSMAFPNIFLQESPNIERNIFNGVLGSITSLFLINTAKHGLSKINTDEHESIDIFFKEMFPDLSYSDKQIYQMSPYQYFYTKHLCCLHNAQIVNDHESHQENPGNLLVYLQPKISNSSNPNKKFRIGILTIEEFHELPEEDKAMLTKIDSLTLRDEINTIEKFRQMIDVNNLRFKDGKSAEEIFLKANVSDDEKAFFNEILKNLVEEDCEKIKFSTIKDIGVFNFIISDFANVIDIIAMQKDIVLKAPNRDLNRIHELTTARTSPSSIVRPSLSESNSIRVSSSLGYGV